MYLATTESNVCQALYAFSFLGFFVVLFGTNRKSGYGIVNQTSLCAISSISPGYGFGFLVVFCSYAESGRKSVFDCCKAIRDWQ